MRSSHALRFSLILATTFLASVVLAQAPDDAQARKLYEEANGLAKDKKYAQALAKVDEAIKLAPKNDAYPRFAAQVAFHTSKFDDGLRYAQAAVKINAQDPFNQFLVASNAFQVHDFALTKEYCQKLAAAKVKFEKANLDYFQFLNRQVSERKVTIPLKIRLKDGVFKKGELYLPMPTVDMPFQAASYDVTGAKKHRVVRQNDNDVLLLTPDGNGAMDVTFHVTRTPHSLKKQLAEFTDAPLPRAVLPYLGKSPTIDPASAKLKEITTPLKGKNAVATVNNLMAWIDENVHYQFKPPKHEFKKVEEIIAREHAECGGYSNLLTALCRSAGIPARQVLGLTHDYLRYLPPEHLSSHVWVEVYLGQLGWVSIDPQKPGSLGLAFTDHIRLYHYEDALKADPNRYNLPLANNKILFRNTLGVKYQERR